MNELPKKNRRKKNRKKNSNKKSWLIAAMLIGCIVLKLPSGEMPVMQVEAMEEVKCLRTTGLAAVNPEAETESSLCVSNLSETHLTFSGDILTQTDDLVYRHYGANAVNASAGSRLIISSITDILMSYDVEGICVYNCTTKEFINVPLSGDMEYEVPAEGAYEVFAVTTEGEFIDLSERVSIEISMLPETDKNDSAPNEKGGIIQL